MSNTKNFFILILLFFLVFATVSPSLSQTTKVIQTERVIKQQGNSFVDFGRPPGGVENWEFVQYHIPVTKDDINKTIKLDFTLPFWNKGNIKPNLNIFLTLNVFDPSNNLLDNISIPFQRNSETYNLKTTIIGDYICKLIFNYHANIFSSSTQGGDVHAIVQLQITGLNVGSVYAISSFGDLNNIDPNDYVSLHDRGNTVDFWADITESGLYTLKFVPMTPTFQILMKFIQLTDSASSNSPITLNVTTQQQYYENFNFNITTNDLGQWKMSYQEQLANLNAAYRLILTDPQGVFVNLYFPLADGSSPFTTTNFGTTSKISINASTPFAEVPITFVMLVISTYILKNNKRHREQ